MSTYKEIQDELKRRLREVAPSAVVASVKWAINEAQIAMARRLRAWFLEADYSATLAANAQSIVLPANFIKEIYVMAGNVKLAQRKERHVRIENSGIVTTPIEIGQYWLSTPARTPYYSTGKVNVVPGTCAVNAGSAAPSFPADIGGRFFRIASSGDNYEIASRFSVTKLILSSAFSGTTSAANQVYQIDPPPRVTMCFDFAPASATAIALHYYRRLPSLVNDNDFPVVPVEYHSAIVEGGMYFALADSQANDANIQRAEKRWEQKLAEITAENEESGDLEQEISFPDTRSYRKNY